MKQINMRFLSSIFVLCVFGIADAFAAPSVKMLGTNKARVGSNAAVVTSNINSGSSSQPQQRLGSVRAKTINSAAPVTITSAPASSNSGADSRISLGNASLNKYLYSQAVSGGPSKPASAPAASGVTERDFSQLSDRVQDLEEGMDDKQDNIGVGEGLVFEDNTISFNNTYNQLPAQVTEMQTTLNTKVTQADVNTTVSNSLNNYYTKTEVQNMLDEVTGPDVKTVYDYVADERKYVTFVDEFDPTILAQ